MALGHVKLVPATLFILAALSQLPPQVEASARCSYQGFAGVCSTAASCSASNGNSTQSTSCQEGGSVCCYKTSCASGGSCKWTDQCTAPGSKPVPNLCPGPTEFQCCVTTPTPTTPAPTGSPCGGKPCGESHAPFVYVALGDSYAAGLGSTDHYDLASGSCKRSPNAYPKLLAEMLNAQLDFRACSGATVEDVRTQLDTLSDSTNLVTLSVGGNDLGFGSILTRCIKYHLPHLPGLPDLPGLPGCDLSTQFTYANTVLKDKLVEFYNEVKSKARNARIVVSGYPRLFADQLKDQVGNCVIIKSDWVKVSDMTKLNKLADTLADVVKSAAEISGVEYVDVRERFDDHAICDADAWLNGVSLEKKAGGGIGFGGSDETAHPNKKGQEEYAKAVMCKIRGQYCG